nr:ABC transporter substrate-binding protein [Acidaminobacter sp. JC074]
MVLDPQEVGGGNSNRIVLNLFDPLVRTTPEGEVYNGGVAESWDVSEDGMVYTFHIRENVKFHNGDLLTSEDVVFSMNRALVSPHSSEMYSSVESVEKVDDYTVKLYLKYPYSSILNLLAEASGCIANKKAVEEMGDEYGRKPIGTGPFKFSEWQPGSSITAEAFPDYFLGEAAIKKVTWKVIADKSTAVVALEKGEIDAYLDIASIDRQTIEKSEDLAFYEGPSSIYDYLGLNTESGPMSDVKVRQAVAYAIDKESIILAARDGVGQIADCVVSENMVGYPDSVKVYNYDVEKAKAILKESAYPDGFTCTLLTLEGHRSKTAQVVQANLSEIGIEAEIKILEWGTFVDTISIGDFDMLTLAWGYSTPDADGIYQLFHSDFIGTSNYSRYNNEAVNDLLDQQKIVATVEDKEAIFNDVFAVLDEDVPIIPLYWWMNNVACNSDLQGVKIHPLTMYYIYDYSWK